MSILKKGREQSLSGKVQTPGQDESHRQSPLSISSEELSIPNNRSVFRDKNNVIKGRIDLSASLKNKPADMAIDFKVSFKFDEEDKVASHRTA